MGALGDAVMGHPWVRACEVGAVLAAHPWDPPGNNTPVAHHRPSHGWSVLINANSKLQHRDKVLPDGETIEFRPCPASPNDLAALDDLAATGARATLYVLYQGRAAQGTVRLAKPGSGDAYHARLVKPPTSWADMLDSE